MCWIPNICYSFAVTDPGGEGQLAPPGPHQFFVLQCSFLKSYFVSECFKIKLREHHKPDSFVSWESSPGESSGGVVLIRVHLPVAVSYQRNWVGRGYLAAVAGSTWLLRDLRRAYCGRLSRTLRNIHAIYTSHSIREKSFYVALTQRLRVKLYLHS